jgi:hypothetical protein
MEAKEYQLLPFCVWKYLNEYYGGDICISKKAETLEIVEPKIPENPCDRNFHEKSLPLKISNPEVPNVEESNNESFQIRVIKVETEELKAFAVNQTATIREVIRTEIS